MKQILQDLVSGDTYLADLPAPRPSRSRLLVRTTASLVSSGTERMLVEFGRAGWLGKARQQPERVRQVLDKLRTDGLLPTVDAVRSKLDQPLRLGYCNVGRVEELGPGVRKWSVGDRVASNGPHAELVSVPQNLCAAVSDGVSDAAAAFSVVGAIGLQGVRLARPTLGECFVVTGLGLIGLLTVQLLRAHGCRVLGVDLDDQRLALGRRFGAETVNPAAGEDVVAAARGFSKGQGVDGVLLTLSSADREPVSQAARMCRKRGRIVLVGVAPLELNRAEFYEKELSFQVSCSYGPGRHDPAYEEKGQDYPLAFVRWTAQRNIQAVLEMMASGRLDPTPLITHRYDLEDAPQAYELLTAGDESSLGILIRYPSDIESEHTISLETPSDGRRTRPGIGEPVVAVLGAGDHATRVLLPALKKAEVRLHGIASVGGMTAAHHGRRFGFGEATTDANALIEDRAVNTVVVATRHDSHAPYVRSALEAGKHVFVEKPLALTRDELDDIADAWRSAPSLHGGRPLLMVGFNRRFSPLTSRMRSLLDTLQAPKSFVLTVNAGTLSPDHWVNDPELGGGRIIGEVCHFIDLMRHLAGAPIARWALQTIGNADGMAVRDDQLSVTLAFADGSFGTIHYLANGHRSFPKERVEAFGGGRVLRLENFRQLRGWGWSGFRKKRLWRQDKGHDACLADFVAAIRDGDPAPIPFEELMEVSRVTVEVGEAARRQSTAAAAPPPT